MAQTEVEVGSSAQADVNFEGKAGMTPDSPWYGFKTFGEKMRLAFTFKQEAKAKTEIELAELRLLEAKAMFMKGNVEAFKKAQEKHDELIVKAKERISKIEEDGDSEKIRMNAGKLVGLERAIEVHNYKIDKLKEIISSGNLSEEQIAKFEEKISMMQNKTEDMRDKIDDRKEKMKTKLRAITEKSESEIDDEIEKIEKDSGLTNTMQERAKHRIEFMENKILKLETWVAELNSSEENITWLKTEITNMKEDLSQAKAFYDEKNYDESLGSLKRWGEMESFFRKQMNEERKILNEERKEMREKMNDELKEAREKMKETREKVRDEMKEARENIKEDAKEFKEKKNLVKERIKAELDKELNAAKNSQEE